MYIIFWVAPTNFATHIPWIVFEMIRLRTMEFNKMDQRVENKLILTLAKTNNLNFYQVS